LADVVGNVGPSHLLAHPAQDKSEFVNDIDFESNSSFAGLYWRQELATLLCAVIPKQEVN
jgi:hypothetical protein